MTWVQSKLVSCGSAGREFFRNTTGMTALNSNPRDSTAPDESSTSWWSLSFSCASWLLYRHHCSCLEPVSCGKLSSWWITSSILWYSSGSVSCRRCDRNSTPPTLSNVCAAATCWKCLWKSELQWAASCSSRNKDYLHSTCAWLAIRLHILHSMSNVFSAIVVVYRWITSMIKTVVDRTMVLNILWYNFCGLWECTYSIHSDNCTWDCVICFS